MTTPWLTPRREATTGTASSPGSGSAGDPTPWCSSSDSKSKIQELNRSQLILPMMLAAERHSHDCVRHDTTSLSTALGVVTGKVLGSLRWCQATSASTSCSLTTPPTRPRRSSAGSCAIRASTRTSRRRRARGSTWLNVAPMRSPRRSSRVRPLRAPPRSKITSGSGSLPERGSPNLCLGEHRRPVVRITRPVLRAGVRNRRRSEGSLLAITRRTPGAAQRQKGLKAPDLAEKRQRFRRHKILASRLLEG